MNIIWSYDAIKDLRDLRTYISRRDRGSAAVVLSRIRASIQSLEQLPSYGRAGRLPGTRELVVPRTPYVVVYRVTAQAIQIARVLHGSQDWPPTVDQ